MKGLRRTYWQLQNSHRDVKHSIGNIVGNIVITVYGVRWVLEIPGGPLCKVSDCVTTMHLKPMQNNIDCKLQRKNLN